MIIRNLRILLTSILRALNKESFDKNFLLEILQIFTWEMLTNKFLLLMKSLTWVNMTLFIFVLVIITLFFFKSQYNTPLNLDSLNFIGSKSYLTFIASL